jgi:hypothetical protein
MTTPQSTVAGSGSSSAGGHFLIPHNHSAGTLSRQEPLYDAANVYINGVLVALYNAATTTGSFTAPTVPKVTVTSAVQNVEGDDNNTAGKAEADRFLAEGRITKADYDKITTTPKPAGEGVKPGAVVAGKDSAAVVGDLSYATVLTPKGTTLGTMIKNVTFPRTIQQLAQSHPSVTSPQNVVNNLAALALNVYEPVKAKYPNAFMTNSYRHGASIGGGAHGTGQACDIQFRGVGAYDYYDIAVWMSKNIPYDQLLLEYLPGKTVWIHVSYAIPGLPYGGISTRQAKGIGATLATLNGAAGGKFTPNLHADIIQAALTNKVVAA